MSKKTKKVRLLKDIDLDHIALTSNGAASFKDEPFLLKALDVEKESEPAGTDEGNTGEAPEQSGNENKDNGEAMNPSQEDLQKQVDALLAEKAQLEKQIEDQKQAEIVKAASVEYAQHISDAEIVKELATKFNGEEKELILRALAAKQAEVITKSADLEKKATVEKGEAGEPEPVVEPTQTQTILEKTRALLENK